MKRFATIIALAFVFVSSTNVLFAQEGNQGVPFNGLITDITGKPAKLARVYITEGLEAQCDKQGHFGLTDVKSTDTLKVVFKKRKYEIPVEGRKSIKIRLGDQILNDPEAIQESNELVDYGYGWVKRRESIDPSNGIPGEVIRRSGASNIIDAIAGRVSGVRKINRSNGGTSLMIRGGSGSPNTDGSCLFVVDGVENEDVNWVLPELVESVEILKDGSMYGNKGANGVVIIHTLKANSKK